MKLKMKKLNLGSGENYREGWVNVDLGNKNDLNENIRVDVIHNLNKFPYPFKDNEFDEVLLNQVLEHLDNPVKVMKETVRISKNDAVIIIRVPHFSDVGACEKPTHKRFFSLNSIEFMKFNCEVLEKKLELHHNLILKIIGRIFIFSSFIYEHYLHGYFPIKGIRWVLRVRKKV